MVGGAAGISQQWRNSTFRLPLTLWLPHDSIKEKKGGGGGPSFSFFSFFSLSALFPSVPWLPVSVPEPFHYLGFLLSRACSCPGPVVLVSCSYQRPKPSNLSSTMCSCSPSPVPAVPPPPLQSTPSAVASFAAQSRRCRALVHPVCAQYIATPSCGLCSTPAVLLDYKHGPYPGWF